MAAPPDGTPVSPLGGWALHGGRDELDLAAMLERYGIVYRHPVTDRERAAEMAPGQPCFLLRTDRSRVVGLWAVGEVVGRAEALPASMVPAPAPATTSPGDDQPWYVEVELLPLAKPIALEKLVAEPPLSRSELARWERTANPLRLRPDEVRAIEGFEFWLDEPSDDQRQAFDRLLADEDAAQS